MNSSTVFRSACAFATFALLAGSGWGAADPRKSSLPGKTSTSSAAQRSSTTRPGAKGPLPDPVLLDGATLPAEKKSEYGMIGDFELPGDENNRSGKVGGPQNPGQQMPQAGSMPMGLPQAGGGPQGQQENKQAQGGGTPPAEQGQQNQSGNQAAGGSGEQGAKPEGAQVGQLGGEPSGEQPGANTGEKPKPVAIGDTAMRIPATQSAAGVVGGQQQVVGNTQHHEKGTGTGGKGPTGAQGGNRVEKGRTIPAGL